MKIDTELLKKSMENLKKFSNTKTGAVVLFIVLPSTLVGAYYGTKWLKKKYDERKENKQLNKNKNEQAS